MSKITDDELINAIWNRQVRRLATKVIHQYVGGRISVCDSDRYWESTVEQHVCSRQKITDKIGKQQLLRRIRNLYASGRIQSTYGGRLLTFRVGGDRSKEPFDYARQWWLDRGVPTGYSDFVFESGAKGTRANTVKMDGWQKIAKTLEQELIEHFGCQN